MTKKEKFINLLEQEIFSKDLTNIDEDVMFYWEAFKGASDAEKPLLTDNGKLILKYLQTNTDKTILKARDIGDGLCISSKTVSGAIRKLVTDGFVEKIGENPTMYSITDSGKNIEI